LLSPLMIPPLSRFCKNHDAPPFGMHPVSLQVKATDIIPGQPSYSPLLAFGRFQGRREYVASYIHRQTLNKVFVQHTWGLNNNSKVELREVGRAVIWVRIPEISPTETLRSPPAESIQPLSLSQQDNLAMTSDHQLQPTQPSCG